MSLLPLPRLQFHLFHCCREARNTGSLSSFSFDITFAVVAFGVVIDNDVVNSVVGKFVAVLFFGSILVIR